MPTRASVNAATRAQLPAPAKSRGGGGRARRVFAWLLHHRLIVGLVTIGAVLRLLSLMAYWPALVFWSDSWVYLKAARTFTPSAERPFGYSAFLAALDVVGPLYLVPLVQHSIGLGLGIGIYALLRRRGLPTWLCALAAAPVLLDAYQIDIEHFVLAETLFSAVLLALLAVLVGRDELSLPWVALAGLLAAVASLVRTVGFPVAVLVAGWLLLRRAGPRRLVVYVFALAVPLAGYSAWFGHVYGQPGLELSSGRFLYGKVAPFADCRVLELTPEEQMLCDPDPPDTRLGPNYYTWVATSPAYRFAVNTPEAEQVYSSFAQETIRRRPLAYLRAVARDLYHYADPVRVQRPRDSLLISWLFPVGPPPDPWTSSVSAMDFDGTPMQARLDLGPAQVLSDYQQVAATPGILLAGLGLLALVGASLPGRGRPSGVRVDLLFLAAIGAALVLTPAATTAFDYRYLLPVLVVLPPAGALAVEHIRQRRNAAAPATEEQ